MAVVSQTDWDDPCARAKVLRTAYFETLSGRSTSIRYKNGDEERELKFSDKNLEVLKREMQQAEADCAISAGTGRARRFAIGTGTNSGFGRRGIY